MSVSSEIEQASTHPPTDRCEDYINEPSCDELDQDLHQLSNNPFHIPPQHRLPTEVWTSIAQHAFSPSLDCKAAHDPYFIDGQPDLTLMKVNSQLRQILQKRVLPSTLMILVRRYNCEHYPFAEEDEGQIPYTRFLASGDTEPWISISRIASVVSIRVLCGGPACTSDQGSYTVATLYSATNKVNILTLSQLVMQRSQNTDFRPVIGVIRSPKSIRGTQLIRNFFKDFTSLIRPALSGTISDNQKFFLKMRQFRMPWTEGAAANESYFRELQFSLDNMHISIDKMIMNAVDFSKHISSTYVDPFEMIGFSKLPSVIANNIHKGCTLSIILEGLSEYILC